MCRLFGFRGERPASLTCSLRDAENALINQTRDEHGEHRNADGWGIGFYQNGQARVKKNSSAAFDDPDFGTITEGVSSTTIIAHVRRSTIGEPSLENTHPFRWGPWLFAHNGTVESFDRLRQRLFERIHPSLRAEIKGETDSEYCFYLFLSHLMKRADARSQDIPSDIAENALKQTICLLDELSAQYQTDVQSRLNFLCSNGPLFLATRRGKGLFSIERRGVLDREVCAMPERTNVQYEMANGNGSAQSVLVASETITQEPEWKEIPDESMLRVDATMQIELLPLS